MWWVRWERLGRNRNQSGRERRGAERKAALPDRRRPRAPYFYGLPLTPERLTRAVEESTRVALLGEAEEVLRGRWRFFAFADGPSDPTPDGLTDWHRCELTGSRADENLIPTPDFCPPAETGELRAIWEKSRHHHTTVLALAYALTGDSRYAVGAAARIADWLGANPPQRGVNWASGLELGLRLMSWAWCYELLRPHPDWGTWFGPESPLWPSLHGHQVSLEAFGAGGPQGSDDSDLLGGLAGQYVASVTWPVFPESARWQREAKQALTRAATLQFFESGVSRERGLGAHVFATEVLLLPALLGERNGDAFDPAYLARVARAIAVAGRLRGVDGASSHVGNVEERLSVQLEPRGGSRVDWLLRVGRDWLGVPVPEPHGGRLGATLLLGDRRVPLHADPGSPNSSFAYPDAGLFVLASGAGTGHPVRVLTYAGLLSSSALDGRGHTDALSFTLAVGPQAVVVAPDTSTFHTDAGWQRHFRSTAAHNTVEVDGQNQGVCISTPWTRQVGAVAQLWESWEDGARLVASHDGYAGLIGAPVHHREFELRGHFLSVTDHLAGQGHHDLRLHLHLHPDCEVHPESGHTWRVTWSGGGLRLRFDERLRVTLGVGEHNPASGSPPLGWYAPRSGVRWASPSLRATLTATLPVTLHTTLEVF